MATLARVWTRPTVWISAGAAFCSTRDRRHRHGLRRRPVAGRCLRCRRPVLLGIDIKAAAAQDGDEDDKETEANPHA